MSGNSEIIDSVVDPVAIEQFNALKAASAEATEQMVIATKAAIALNNATGGSQSFSVFKKNAEAANVAVNTIIVNSQKVQQAEDKARQYKAEMDERAMNKYLVLMSKQQAAQEAQDAKEIAAAQKKAEKLAQIQAEADAKAAKRASVIGPTIIGGEGENAARPELTGTVANQSDLDRAQAANEATVSKTQSAAASEKNTAAIVEETVALSEQQKILNAVNGTFEQNISLQLTLQSELAAVRADMKLLNTETESGRAKQESLVAEELRLKTAIQQNSTVLRQQAKDQISTEGSANQLEARLAQLRAAFNSLSTEEQKNVAIGGTLIKEIELLDAETKRLSDTQGVHNKHVGDYERGQTKVAAAIEKVTNLQNVGARIITQFSRQIIGLATGFLSLEIGAKAIEVLINYIKQLDIFNPIATESQRVQKGLSEAFASADYSKAIQGVEELASNLDLVKTGIIDSDVAINKYNETIGKTFGYVNNLNDAQAGFIEHENAYIKAVLQEAAANAILADSGKELAEIGKKQQDIRNTNRRLADNTETDIFGQKVSAGAKYNQPRIEQGIKEIANLEKRKDEIIKNTIGALDEVKIGTPNKGLNGADAVAELATKIANEELERRKIIDQNIINDEKKSYEDRLNASSDFYAASKQQLDNDTYLKLRVLPANDARIADIEKDYANRKLQLTQTRDNQLQALEDKRFKQQQENAKKDLTTQKDLAKEIVDNQSQSLSARLAALDIYKDKSAAILKINEKEALRDAGQNGESVKAAHKDYNNASLALDKEYNADRLKIFQEVNEKLKQNLSDYFSFGKADVENTIQQLQDVADRQLQILEDQRNKESAILDKKYTDHKISKKKYDSELLALDDQYNIDRLGQIAFYEQSVLELKQRQEDTDVNFARGQGASSSQIAEIKSKSGVKEQQKKVDEAGNNLGNALKKQGNDQAKQIPDTKAEINAFAEQASKALEIAQQAEDAHYQHQIDLLEEKKKLIDENTSAQIDGVNKSILSEADKQRKINVINAQAAQQKVQIDAQEKNIKQKQAKFDKAASITRIIEETAIAVMNALSIPVFGEALAITIGAIGAAQLALVASQPLPAFARGTKNSPEGWAHVGERGPELMIDPSGKMSLTPGTDTITYLQKGTQIIPNHMIKPEKLNYTGGQQVPWKEVIAAINRNKPQPQKRPVVKVNINNDSYYSKFYR